MTFELAQQLPMGQYNEENVMGDAYAKRSGTKDDTSKMTPT